VSYAAALLARLDQAVRHAVSADEIGAVRSIRLHVGAPADDLPNIETMIALGDALFHCRRSRIQRSPHALLCVWEQGQIATISCAPSQRVLIVLTALGSTGALHFRQGGS
jgi:hypothetical protein